MIQRASALVACLALLEGCAPEATSPRRPNVLLVTVDTTRADRLSCYGGAPGVSPVMDGLAAAGGLFERAFTPMPMTLPAHATVMTGEIPPVHGVRMNAVHRLSMAARTLAEVFTDGGYSTAAFVSAEVLRHQQGLAQGFAHYDDEIVLGQELGVPERGATETTDRALTWLRQRTADQPFFLWVHYFDPHEPYVTRPDLEGKFQTAYEAEIHHVDRNLGRLLGELEKRGWREETLICVTADHGEGFREHGELTHGLFVYQDTVHVPMIWTGPGVAAGRRWKMPVSLTDVAPTLLELAGLPALDCGGASLAPVLGGEPGRLPVEHPIYLESYVTHMSYGWSPLEGVVQGRWKYIWAPRPELYDLDLDPDERKNLVEIEQERVRTLQESLDQLRQVAGKALPSETVTLTPEEVERLALLGYVAPQGEAHRNRSFPPPGAEAGPDPKDRTQIFALLQSLERAKVNEPAEVEALARKILQADPGNTRALQNLGITLVQQGRFADARAPLEALEATGRSSAASLAALGRARLRTGDQEGAREAFERCLALEPETLVALSTLAAMAVKAGEADRARDLFQRLLPLTDDPAIRRAIEARLRDLEDR